MRRPYVGIDQYNDSVHVIWHYDIFIQYNMGEMRRYFIPTLFYDFARIVQPHFAIDDFAEQTHSIMYADGHEIVPGL